MNSGTKLFLLADDDGDDADLFKEALSIAAPPIGFSHVSDGVRVFQFLSNSKNAKPDLIFLDLNMPLMNGWQCLAKLKNHTNFKEIPVIMYSTSSHYRDKEIAKELGALAFFTKPSDFSILVKTLAYISRHSREELPRMTLLNF
jgi:CheY-like chemotaxis protein